MNIIYLALLKIIQRKNYKIKSTLIKIHQKIRKKTSIDFYLSTMQKKKQKKDKSLLSHGAPSSMRQVFLMATEDNIKTISEHKENRAEIKTKLNKQCNKQY